MSEQRFNNDTIKMYQGIRENNKVEKKPRIKKYLQIMLIELQMNMLVILIVLVIM